MFSGLAKDCKIFCGNGQAAAGASSLATGVSLVPESCRCSPYVKPQKIQTNVCNRTQSDIRLEHG